MLTMFAAFCGIVKNAGNPCRVGVCVRDGHFLGRGSSGTALTGGDWWHAPNNLGFWEILGVKSGFFGVFGTKSSFLWHIAPQCANPGAAPPNIFLNAVLGGLAPNLIK